MRSSIDGGGTCTRDWTASATNANADQHHERSLERCREEVAGEARRLRTDQAADDAARQHEGDRLRAVVRRCNLGSGKPVLEADRVVDADDPGGDAEQREAPGLQRVRSYQTAHDVDRRARHEPRTAADPAIHSDIGIAASAEPSTYVVAPNVASVFVSASENPTRPFIEIRPDALISSSAWQLARRKMSRRDVCKKGPRPSGATTGWKTPESPYDKRT